MNADRFKGTGVALITPFTSEGAIDWQALDRLVEYVIAGGVDYLVALGTTAETPVLHMDEKKAILQRIVEVNQKRLPFVCGIGGNHTVEILDWFKTYPLDGVDALLSVTPYYNKPGQQGLLAHYRTLNQYTPLPIIVYNVPGRTAVNMLADTTLQLARDCEHIIGIKEASGDMVQCMQLVQNRPEGFLLLSGDDNLALAQMAIGFDGVISVAANAYARAFSTMIRQAADGNIQQARTLHYEWLPGIDLLFSEGNPAGIKCALHLMGYCGNHLRLPLVPVSAHMSQALAQFLHKHHLIALS